MTPIGSTTLGGLGHQGGLRSAIPTYALSLQGTAAMTTERKSVTRFLNVDLDLRAKTGLDEMLQALAPPLFILHQTEDRASAELVQSVSSLEQTICGLVAVIEALSPRARDLWDRCDMRTMNIGIQAGAEPHDACFTISKHAVSLLACVRSDIAITVYAPPAV
jgi:hypothetical protein